VLSSNGIFAALILQLAAAKAHGSDVIAASFCQAEQWMKPDATYCALREPLPWGKISAVRSELGERMLPEIEERYRSYAAECLRIAQDVAGSKEKLALLNMAQHRKF
jgi:hypothetical protein